MALGRAVVGHGDTIALAELHCLFFWRSSYESTQSPAFVQPP